ncbi:MAG: GLUG motif-containing protein [Bacillota bacterium]
MTSSKDGADDSKWNAVWNDLNSELSIALRANDDSGLLETDGWVSAVFNAVTPDTIDGDSETYQLTTEAWTDRSGETVVADDGSTNVNNPAQGDNYASGSYDYSDQTLDVTVSETIQGAVDAEAIEPGDSIHVHSGTYEEDVTIGKDNLTIEAVEEGEAVVEGSVTLEANGAESADAAGMDNEETQSIVYFQVEEESMNPLLSPGAIIEVISGTYADGDLVVAQKSDGPYIVKMLDGDQLVSLGAGTNYAANDVTILGAVAPSATTQGELKLNGLSLNSVLAETSEKPTSGNGSEGAPYQIEKWENLYWLSQESDEWGKYFVQTAAITFPENHTEKSDGIYDWDDDKGWTPIGNSTTKFTGSYDGMSNTISNLYIKRTNEDYVGLFGYIDGATLTNITLVDVDVTADDRVGGLVGENDEGNITNSSATGAVNGDNYIGGLVGYIKKGAITNSSTTAIVKGTGLRVGGLVGYNRYSTSTVTNSSAEGKVIGGGRVGGLVGENNGEINISYAEGTVSNSDYVGGLVGENDGGTIIDSHATGDVTGEQYVGGLVGDNDGGTITFSYATGTVKGTDLRVGGLVGRNNGGDISNSYATGIATGIRVGGLVGENNGEINESYATGNVTGTSDYEVGGLVGENSSSGTILGSYATGTVKGEDGRVGGLVGENDEGTITDSHATGTVEGTDKWVGGLVGQNYNGDISNSYATGDVIGKYRVGGLVGDNIGVITNSYATGAVTADAYVGGLVGSYNGGNISNSYATGAVNGISNVGGLVGENIGGNISNSYATGKVTGLVNVGGLVGCDDEGTVTDSFWDTETSGQKTSDGGEGKTTAKMKTLSTFSGANWSITGEDGSYPLLWWQVGNDEDPTWHMVAPPGTPDPTSGSDWFSYDPDYSFSLLTPPRKSATVLTAISDQDANPMITPAFVTGGSAADLDRAIAVYNQAKQSYEADKGTMSAADKAVAETELAVANAAIIALELMLAAQSGAAINPAELIAANNAALAVLNSNRDLLTAEQIAEAEALLNAITTVISRFSS